MDIYKNKYIKYKKYLDLKIKLAVNREFFKNNY